MITSFRKKFGLTLGLEMIEFTKFLAFLHAFKRFLLLELSINFVKFFFPNIDVIFQLRNLFLIELKFDLDLYYIFQIFNALCEKVTGNIFLYLGRWRADIFREIRISPFDFKPLIRIQIVLNFISKDNFPIFDAGFF